MVGKRFREEDVGCEEGTAGRRRALVCEKTLVEGETGVGMVESGRAS